MEPTIYKTDGNGAKNIHTHISQIRTTKDWAIVLGRWTTPEMADIICMLHGPAVRIDYQMRNGEYAAARVSIYHSPELVPKVHKLEFETRTGTNLEEILPNLDTTLKLANG